MPKHSKTVVNTLAFVERLTQNARDELRKVTSAPTLSANERELLKVADERLNNAAIEFKLVREAQ